MNRQSGNILIYILGAILLLGLLIMLVKGSFQEGTGVDSEKVFLKAQQVQSYAGEVARGVTYVLSNGVSEADIRFAVPTGFTAIPAYGTYSDAPNMVFAPTGGGVEYKMPPAGVNDGTVWGFYSATHISGMGTENPADQKAELMAVLPNVTEAFCNQINRNVKQNIDLTQIQDVAAGGCVYMSGFPFAGTFTSGPGTNGLALPLPAPAEACIRCTVGLHYYKVLMAR